MDKNPVSGDRTASQRTNLAGVCPLVMSCSQSIERPTQSKRAPTLARPLAPEDVLRGDYVTPLHTVWEVPSFFWCDDEWQRPREEPVRMQLMAQDSGVPLKVKRVCLPFALVEHPWHGGQTLDLRRCRIARLDKDFARVAWKAMKKTHAIAAKRARAT